MCGIVGFIDKKSILTQKEKGLLVNKMLGLIGHRGRDEIGSYIHKNVVLGSNRLSIIDTRKLSHQPVENSRAVLSYNGEIYNYKDLGGSKQSSDTSALLDYLSQGKSTLKLDGIFAFAYFDKKTNTITLQNDSFGVKPLYYYEDEKFFAWSSEIKAFSVLPSYSPSFNEKKLNEYLVYRYIAGQDTLIKEVMRIQQGQVTKFEISTNNLSVLKACLPVSNCIDKPSPKLCLSLIRRAVTKNLMADVPIGMQLSGGIDSTIIALIAKEIYPNLKTYSIGMKDNDWNEFKYSDLVARKISSDHTKIRLDYKEIARLFNEVTYYLDEPITHINTIPLFLLAKKAREHVKVLLTGEGADELLGGYRRYNNLSSKELFNKFSSPFQIKRLLKQKYRVSKLGRQQYFRTNRKISLLQQYSLYDLRTYLPGVLLRQDKASMAANIESRTPFLNKEISKYLFNLSDNDKQGKHGNKSILKEILLSEYGFTEDFVNREKCGFGLPIDRMMRDKNILRERVLKLPEHTIIKKYFLLRPLEKVIEQFLKGDTTHVGFLFTLISLVSWYDIFIQPSKSKDV